MTRDDITKTIKEAVETTVPPVVEGGASEATTTNRFIALASVEDTNGSRDPYISVTYTAASASTPQQVMFFE